MKFLKKQNKKNNKPIFIIYMNFFSRIFLKHIWKIIKDIYGK